MTMMIHTDIAAPISPRIRINLEFFAGIAKALVQAHRRNREAQNLLKSHDAIMKDVGFTRIKANGNTYLFSHRN